MSNQSLRAALGGLVELIIGAATLYNADCMDVLPALTGIDAVVTDPPYEIGMFGAGWDKSGITYSVDLWRRILCTMNPGSYLLSFGGARTYHRMTCAVEDAGFKVIDKIEWIYGQGFPKSKNLKPAHESILMARRPGTSNKLNIENCRIPPGRWPANVIHDGSAAVLSDFPIAHGAGHARAARRTATGAGSFGLAGGDGHRFGDGGNVARFFYCAKPSPAERAAYNDHPTVKPIALMRWLCRLVTPPGGIVLDPFSGSGSTGVAAIDAGFRYIGIEREREYFDIQRRRLTDAQQQHRLSV